MALTVAHLFDVLVDRAVFLDEQIPLWHVRFGLVVIVITYEVLHRVLGKELAKLAVQLGRQRLVGCKDDGRPPQSGNHVGHRERFARARDAQQRLVAQPVLNAFYQLANGHWLIACRRVRLEELER
jgi:hypothetical protein